MDRKFLIFILFFFFVSCKTIQFKAEKYDILYAKHFFDDAKNFFKNNQFVESIRLCNKALKNLLLTERENLKSEELDYYDELFNKVCRLRLRAELRLSKKEEKSSSSFPFEFNSRVEKWIKYYTDGGKKYLEKWIDRSRYYIDIFKEKLRQFNMPEELAYVPIVESGAHPFAVSKKNAVGLWQFILPTGKKYGLEKNHWYDERRDPEKSTIAACKMLKELYDEFGDWLLALAAYNAGKYKILKEIKRQNTREFWDLYLPKETENYVAKIMAVNIIMKDPVVFGFEQKDSETLDYETVQVFGPVDLKLVSKLTGVSLKELLYLNPELTHQCTPPDKIPYSLKVPEGKGAIFIDKFSKLSKSKKYLSKKELQARKHKVIVHRVRYGDNLWKIARKYRVSIRKLRKWNRLTKKSYIYPGQKLKIYR